MANLDKQTAGLELHRLVDIFLDELPVDWNSPRVVSVLGSFQTFLTNRINELAVQGSRIAYCLPDRLFELLREKGISQFLNSDNRSLVVEIITDLYTEHRFRRTLDDIAGMIVDRCRERFEEDV